MNVASTFMQMTKDEIKALLDGGSLTIYSVARPISADLAVDRSGPLASFTFATPAFGAEDGECETPAFAANPVPASHVGTPGFARACKADGTVVAGFLGRPRRRAKSSSAKSPARPARR